MARNTDEIQADIALTRRLIEGQLDSLERKIPRRWWTPYALMAGGLALGLIASKLPVLNLVGMSARTVQTGLSVAGALAAVDRFMTDRRGRLAA